MMQTDISLADMLSGFIGFVLGLQVWKLLIWAGVDHLVYRTGVMESERIEVLEAEKACVKRAESSEEME